MRRGFINCSMYKNDATALLVEDGKILFTGSAEEVEARLGDSDECIDLRGMSVYPGFIDSHMHLLELGDYLKNVRLEKTKCAEEVLAEVRKKLSTQEEWILGRGYNEEEFVTDTVLDKNLLDSLGIEKPIALTRACGHVMVVNSKALEIAGITEDLDMDGGHIDFDSGLVEENAMERIRRYIPEPTVEAIKERILCGIEYCSKKGITTVGSDDFLCLTKDYKDVLTAYEQLSFQEKMNVRVVEQCEFPSVRNYSIFLEEGYTFDVGNDLFRIGPLKLIADGSLGARTAALSREYADDPGNKGIFTLDEETMNYMVNLANTYNMPVIAHCIGDAAVDRVLQCFEENNYESNPFRSGIVHCQILRQDQIAKILDLHLSAYFQSQFIEEDAKILRDRVGETFAVSCYPFKTLFENGIASNGSDAPVEMPDVQRGIELAVTRTSSDGSTLNKDECLTINEAIDSYTEKGALNLFMEEKVGALREGMYADFVVMDHDMNDPVSVTDAKIMMTVMNGNTVYEI